MQSLKELTEKILEFRDTRDWQQFHNPKDSAISLALEAAEVLEHFQWKNKDEIESYLRANKDDVGEELADVLFWVLLMSHDFGIDILEASFKKLEKNVAKYPVEKSKGKHTKYDKL